MCLMNMSYVLLLLTASLLTLNGCTGGSRASEPLPGTIPQVKGVSISGSQDVWLVADSGDLWHTTDAGSSWAKVPGATVGGRFHSTSFIDERRGWAVGERGSVWRTSDGGRTWVSTAKLQAPDGDDWVFMGSPQMHFVDEKHGWIVETLSVWRTENGGLSWKKVFSTLAEDVKGQPVSGTFASPAVAVIAGTGGEIYATDDGGEKWRVNTVPEAGDFRHLSFLDNHKGWAVGSGAPHRASVLLKTEDGGKNWRPVGTLSPGAEIYSLQFVSDKEGWAVGRATSDYLDKQLSGSALALHTLDGGKTWQPARVGGGEAFFDKVVLLNRRQGWLFSRDEVYRTDDGGETWTAVFNFYRHE